jgi:hypothetical protein
LTGKAKAILVDTESYEKMKKAIGLSILEIKRGCCKTNLNSSVATASFGMPYDSPLIPIMLFIFWLFMKRSIIPTEKVL